VEVRVLGCLVEKALTTPDYYPLSLNALTNACNQKSNRDPVVSFEETTVVRGLDKLRDKGYALRVQQIDSRVPKYGHQLKEEFRLERPELSLLCELMLRGPQTAGELRGRASRMHEFGSIDEVEDVLERLMDREEPLVAKKPRQVGRKEHRFTHLLSGPPPSAEEEAMPEEAATAQVRTEDERISRLEEETAQLRFDLEALQQEFKRFKSQFEG